MRALALGCLRIKGEDLNVINASAEGCALDLENPCLMLFGLALDALGNAERGKNFFVGRKASIVWLPHRVVLPTY